MIKYLNVRRVGIAIVTLIWLSACSEVHAEIVVPRDPFLPPNMVQKVNTAAGVPSNGADGVSIVLKGIIWDSTKPMAIIEVGGNSKSFGVGDSSSDVTVTRIDRQQVLLNRHGKISILKLGSNNNL